MTEEHLSGAAPNLDTDQAMSSDDTSHGTLQAVNGSKNADTAAKPSSGPKILVVDDSATIRRSAETMLKSAGFDVVTAENGFEALSKVARHNPQLIFVDIMMPRLDGYQTCAIIKNNEQYRSTPVIMLTSKDGLFDQARGRVVGSDLYLTKPFTKEELLGAVQQHAAS